MQQEIRPLNTNGDARLVDVVGGRTMRMSDLRVQDVITHGPNDIGTAREYYAPDGTLVKRDVWVVLLHGQSITGEQGRVG